MPETTSIPGPSTVGNAGARSVGQLVSSVSADLSLLVQKEVELAKLEIGAAAKKVGVGVAGLVLAAVLLIPVALFASIAGAEALALVVSRWLAFLIVAAIYLLFAVVGALFGRSQLKKIQRPERTQKTVKDTIAWAKHPTEASATGLTAGQAVTTPADRKKFEKGSSDKGSEETTPGVDGAISQSDVIKAALDNPALLRAGGDPNPGGDLPQPVKTWQL